MDFLNTFQQFLQLGKISEICEDKEKDQNDNPMYARVLPLNADGVVSLPLIITPQLRGEFGDLKVNDIVLYMTADSDEGIILKRADGKWTEKIPGNLQLVKGKKENTCNVDSERGYLELHEGNFTMDKGDALMKSGNLTMNQGNLTIDKGNTLMKSGNLTMNQGNFTIDKGDALMKSGNLTLAQGNITVQNGKVIVHGDVEIQGNITLTGNLTATGTITAAGAVTAQSVVSQSTVSATGNVSASDVSSASTTLNTVNTELQTLNATYAAHTHTAPSGGGQTTPPVG